MYPSYAQNIGPDQGAQPNSQGRPLSNPAPFPPSNTGGNFTSPVDLNNTGGNFTSPVDLNNTGGNFTSPPPNELNNLTNMSEMPAGPSGGGGPGGGAGEAPGGGGGGPGGGAGEAPGGGGGGPGGGAELIPNQTNPTINGNMPEPKPVIFTKNLSNNSGTSSEQKVATSGSNVYVIWEDTSSGSNSDILFAKSGNNGATFGNVTTNLSDNTGESRNPQIAAFRNNVYVVWEDTSSGSGGNSDILFTKSTDNGATFGNVTNLSNNTGESRNPQIFASGSNVYITWEDTTNKKSDILFAKSGNNGATFGNVTTNLSDNTGESRNPQIAAFRNNVYVVWEDYSLINSIKNQILFARSINNGMTFDNTIRLSNNTGESTNPQIAAFRNNVYVVWEDTSSGSGGNSDIAFIRSPNNGATFGNVIKVNAINGQPLPGQPSDPQIFASRSSVYIAWTNHNVTTGNDMVLFAKSSNNGIAFSDIRSLSNPGGESVLPQIATSGNNVYVTWSYDDTSKATDKANSTLGSSDVLFLRGTSGNFPGSSLLGPPPNQFGLSANISSAAAAPPPGVSNTGLGPETGLGGGTQGATAAPPPLGGGSNTGLGPETGLGGGTQGATAAPPPGG